MVLNFHGFHDWRYKRLRGWSEEGSGRFCPPDLPGRQIQVEAVEPGFNPGPVREDLTAPLSMTEEPLADVLGPTPS